MKKRSLLVGILGGLVSLSLPLSALAENYTFNGDTLNKDEIQLEGDFSIEIAPEIIEPSGDLRRLVITDGTRTFGDTEVYEAYGDEKGYEDGWDEYYEFDPLTNECEPGAPVEVEVKIWGGKPGNEIRALALCGDEVVADTGWVTDPGGFGVGQSADLGMQMFGRRGCHIMTWEYNPFSNRQVTCWW